MIKEIGKNKKINFIQLFSKNKCTDKEFIKKIYIELKKPIFVLALSISNDYYAAEDILQETFIKVINNIDSFTKGTNAKAWILTIARNTALNHVNKLKRECLNEDISIKDNTCFTEEVESSIEFLRLIEPLNEEEKQIVALRLSAGLSHKDISKALAIPLVNVRKKYSRALKKLKQIYKD